MAALYREFNTRGVAMIGVHLEDDAEAVESFGKRFGISFPLALESESDARRFFGILSCPATVLIDRKGQIVGRAVGRREWESEPARRLLRSLLEEHEPVAAQTVRIPAGARQLHKAVHLVKPVEPNDPELTKILDEAEASLKAGDEVVILFDGQSVGALRMNPRQGNTTPLEARGFTRKERQALAKRLRVRYSAAPRNQLEYVQRLAHAGAKVFANSQAVRLSGLANDEIHPVARSIPMAQMEELVDQSDACYNYGGG
jgi:hypothetical protein